MIIMVVGTQDGGEFELVCIEVSPHRCGLTRINHHGMSPVVQRLDVVVLERGNGNNVEHGIIFE